MDSSSSHAQAHASASSWTTITTTTATTLLVAVAATVAAATTFGGGNGASSSMFSRCKPMEEIPSCLSSSSWSVLPNKAVELIRRHINQISNDALIKMIRQLEFWSNEKQKQNGTALTEDEFIELTQRLITTATWRTTRSIDNAAANTSSSPVEGIFQVPKKRFGRTEIMIPIVTCGCMRFQHTWMPDHLPIVASRRTILQSESQDNLKTILKDCLKVGLNHFETSRGYGSSELQLAQAFAELIAEGVIQRSDFILQTKLPTVSSRTEFEQHWNRSWKIFQQLEYIDLLSLWCVTDPDQVDTALLNHSHDNSIMAAALEWKAQGKVKHIGFSTHSNASNIMKLIESNQFDYVNLHYHFFGSYHAEGTDDTCGGQGNWAAVKKALELDMGVFQISPIDKGGKLYAPSSVVTRTIGHRMNPIAFNILHAWETAGMHTASVGLARPSDLDEAMEACRIYAEGDFTELKAAEARLNHLAQQRLGEEWWKKGLLSLPDMFTDPAIQLTHVGHVLWCHNVIAAFGMYSFAKTRYNGLYTCSWNDKKSLQDNLKTMPRGNPGRVYQPHVDYSSSLIHHYDPEQAIAKLKECHTWLCKTANFTPDEIKARGWDTAYDLTVWNEFPDTSRVTVTGVVLQNLTGGLLGVGGGPTKAVTDFANHLRTVILSMEF